MRHRLVASLLATFVLVLAAFTGTSLAGNGHGNGGGNDQHGSSQHSQPPSQPAPQPAPQPAAQSSSSQPSSSPQPAHESHGNSGKQSDTSPSSPATGGDNSHGVKPSNTTKHDTWAKASSDKTKQYGNGKTAGQIATQAGQPNATLHGPGNSQPHKTSCGSHEVDVHALKSHGSKCGSPESAPVTQVKPAKHEEQHHIEDHKPSKPVTPAPAPAKPATHEQGESTWSHEHVTICHATGSSTNPYVRISPSASGVYHGHLGHQDGRDIVPPFTYNGQTLSENWDSAHQAIYDAGCSVPAPAPAPAQALPATHTETPASTCGTTTKTVTEQVIVGVKHFIGPKGSGRYVVIHPSLHSAHYTGKHPDDVPIYETVTKTVDVPASGCPAAQATPAAPAPPAATPPAAPAPTPTPAPAPAPVAQTTATPLPAPTFPLPTATPVGAVKGATVVLTPKTNKVAAASTPKPKPAGGVLGTTTHLGSTITSTRLPFTGLPLWIFVAVAAGLILTGAAVRRSANDGL